MPDIYIDAGLDFKEFLNAAGRRLGMNNGAAKRAFSSNGRFL